MPLDQQHWAEVDWGNNHNAPPYHEQEADRHSSMPHLDDIQDCKDSRLEKFLNPLTPDQQPPFSDLAI